MGKPTGKRPAEASVGSGPPARALELTAGALTQGTGTVGAGLQV